MFGIMGNLLPLICNGCTMDDDYDFIPKCMKLSVFFVNILYWCLGIFGTGVGLYVHVHQIQPVQEMIYVPNDVAFLLIIMGITLFITAFFGFVGALRENMSFLRWYLAILLFLLMGFIAMGVVSFVVLLSPPIVHTHVEETLQNALINYKDDVQSAKYIDKIQTSVQCCGISLQGYKDWKMNPYFACTDDNFSAEKCSVPASCCRFESLEKIDTTCGFGTTRGFLSQLEASSVIYTQGCVVKAEKMIQNASALLGFSAFGIATALICGIIISNHMVNTLEKKMNEYWKRFTLHNNMMNYIPNSAVTKSKVCIDGLWPLRRSCFLM